MRLNVIQIDSNLSWSKGNKSACHVLKFYSCINYYIAYKTLTSHYPACFRYNTFSENTRVMTQRILCTIKSIIIPKEINNENGIFNVMKG